jgi:hypothetical protein
MQVCSRVFKADVADVVVLCLSRVFSTGGSVVAQDNGVLDA